MTYNVSMKINTVKVNHSYSYWRLFRNVADIVADCQHKVPNFLKYRHILSSLFSVHIGLHWGSVVS
jgi:hypothetical protein